MQIFYNIKTYVTAILSQPYFEIYESNRRNEETITGDNIK